MDDDIVSEHRRALLRAGCAVGAAAGIAGVAFATSGRVMAKDPDEKQGGKVTANEDLMREHGVIRRALFVYVEAGRRARTQPSSLPLPALLETARLFRSFAEDYHERSLEEAHIFPQVRKLQGPVAKLPDVLVEQHRRGREITGYVLQIASGRSLSAADAPRLAGTLDALVAMYGPHAAREDTVLFPAWKAALGPDRYAEMGEKFEDIERRQFGHDGFDDAVKTIARIEVQFGLSDLAKVTAPPPPQT